jgi:ABC-type Fe3+/spermidine/putrescine transport system ATPase subunit
MSEKNEIAVEVKHLSKSYGPVQALKSIDLRINMGEYFVLLGPSGGGKTTLLRLIGGFIRPTEGQVFLHNQEVSHLPPNARPTSMVFQSFALFPHMTVAQNVGYGLRLKKLKATEIHDKVANMLETVGLDGYGDRMPHELSGGQQQRVQLARSFVLETDILLLDEPLAALDANLRRDMCIELKRLQEKIGMTFIHVTHNQEEAMTVADNMAIIADGNLIEMGKPSDLYENPIRRFTADFIGANNIFDGQVKKIDDDLTHVDLGSSSISVLSRGQRISVGDYVSVSVRSELVCIINELMASSEILETLSGVHRESVYLGLTTSELITLENGQEILARRISDGSNTHTVANGSPINVGWRQQDGRLHIL